MLWNIIRRPRRGVLWPLKTATNSAQELLLPNNMYSQQQYIRELVSWFLRALTHHTASVTFLTHKIHPNRASTLSRFCCTTNASHSTWPVFTLVILCMQQCWREKCNDRTRAFIQSRKFPLLQFGFDYAPAIWIQLIWNNFCKGIRSRWNNNFAMCLIVLVLEGEWML